MNTVERCRHEMPTGLICEDCIIEGDYPDAPAPEGIINGTSANEPIDWEAVARAKSAELRRWQKSGHPGSKAPVNRIAIAARRKRERQGRKAGRR